MKKISNTVTKISVAGGMWLATLAAPAVTYAQNLIDCGTIKGQQGIGNIPCPEGAAGVGVMVSRAIALVLVIATLLAFVFLIYGGIRWILSGGDKEATAKARGTITAAVIGLALVFLSFVIIQVVGSILGVSPFQLDLSRLTIASP